MNLFMLLPGLRDLRAPLASGYAWLLVAFTVLDIPMKVPLANDPLYRFYELSDAVGIVATGAVVSTIAYLAGLASRAVLVPTVEIARFLLVHLPLNAATIWLEDVGRSYPQPRDIGSERINRITSRRFRGMNEEAILLDELAGRFKHDPTFRDEVYSQINEKRMTFFVANLIRFELDVNLSHQASLVDQWNEDQESRSATEIDKLVEPLNESLTAPDGDLLLDVFLASMIDLQELAGVMGWDFTYAPARLVVNSQPAYERWDRLKAEADFRIAIVPPLLSLVAAFAWFNVVGLPSIYLLIPLFLSLILLRLEHSLADEAREQLLLILRSGLVESEALKLAKNDNLFPRFSRF